MANLKAISSSATLRAIKSLVVWRTAHSYLRNVTAVAPRWHLSDMNVWFKWSKWYVCISLWKPMMTSSKWNGNIFHVTGPSWGESTGHQWIPHKDQWRGAFDVLFDLRLNKRLSKQSRRRWDAIALIMVSLLRGEYKESRFNNCNVSFDSVSCPGSSVILIRASYVHETDQTKHLQITKMLKVFRWFRNIPENWTLRSGEELLSVDA